VLSYKGEPNEPHGRNALAGADIHDARSMQCLLTKNKKHKQSTQSSTQASTPRCAANKRAPFHSKKPAEPARNIYKKLELHQSTRLKSLPRQSTNCKARQLVNVPHIRNGLVKPLQQGCVCVCKEYPTGH
jgi:hypothetical protein